MSSVGLSIPINRYCLHCNKKLNNIHNDWSIRLYHKSCYKIINSVDYFKEIKLDIREKNEQYKLNRDKQEINNILKSWGHTNDEAINVINNLFK